MAVSECGERSEKGEEEVISMGDEDARDGRSNGDTKSMIHP